MPADGSTQTWNRICFQSFASHTHRTSSAHAVNPDQRQKTGLLLNPGEVGGWLTGQATVATVELETLAVQIHDLG